MSKKNLWIIIYTIWGIFVLFVAFFLFPYLDRLSEKHAGCDIHHEVYVQACNFKVVKKYIDHHNHGALALIFSRGGEQGLMYFGSHDAYDFFEPGDSVIKKTNSLDYKIISAKSGKDTIVKFLGHCADSLKKASS